MKEFVLVEFMCLEVDRYELNAKVRALGEDFLFEKTEHVEEIDQDDDYRLYFHLWGKISAEAASFIRLQDPFLAERMRISYIPNDLKDKYRTKK